jgi:hypothetical protein
MCQGRRVGVIYDYFVAASDDVAVDTIDLVGGPEEIGLRTLSVKGVDPVVSWGRSNRF